MKDNKVKRNKPLTRKQQAFVQHLINHPKDSATKAIQATYGSEDKPVKQSTASAIATENLRKPSIISELSKYNNLVENTLINTVSDWGDSDNSRRREIAVDTAKYIHDKVHGKSKQQIDVTSTKVSISIDLSGTTSDTTEEQDILDQ